MANENEVSVWAVTIGGDAIYRTGVTAATPGGVHWEHVNNPQALLAISTCNNNVWTVGRKGELYYREGISEESPGGCNWKLIESPKCGFTYAQKSSVGAKTVSLTKTTAWVLLANGSIAVRTNIGPNQQDGLHWIYISDCELTFRHISSFEREVWAVGSDGALRRRLGVTGDNPSGTTWQLVLPGNFVYVSARGGCFI